MRTCMSDFRSKGLALSLHPVLPESCSIQNFLLGSTTVDAYKQFFSFTIKIKNSVCLFKLNVPSAQNRRWYHSPSPILFFPRQYGERDVFQKKESFAVCEGLFLQSNFPKRVYLKNYLCNEHEKLLVVS